MPKDAMHLKYLLLQRLLSKVYETNNHQCTDGTLSHDILPTCGFPNLDLQTGD